MEAEKSDGKNMSLNIASTLCWVLGVLNLLGGISIGISMISIGRSTLFLVAIFILGILGIGFCVAGYTVRKKRRYAGVLAIIFGAFGIVSPPVIGTIIGITIIVLIATNWKELS